MSTEAKRQLELVDVEHVIKRRSEMFEKFKNGIKHVSPFLQRAMIKAYGEGSDHMARILDEAKSK